MSVINGDSLGNNLNGTSADDSVLGFDGDLCGTNFRGGIPPDGGSVPGVTLHGSTGDDHELGGFLGDSLIGVQAAELQAEDFALP